MKRVSVILLAIAVLFSLTVIPGFGQAKPAKAPAKMEEKKEAKKAEEKKEAKKMDTKKDAKKADEKKVTKKKK